MLLCLLVIQFLVEFVVYSLPGDLLQLIQHGPCAIEGVHVHGLHVSGAARSERVVVATIHHRRRRAIVLVQATHAQIGQGAGTAILEQKIIAPLQMDDRKVAGGLVVGGLCAGGVVLVVFHDA